MESCMAHTHTRARVRVKYNTGFVGGGRGEEGGGKERRKGGREGGWEGGTSYLKQYFLEILPGDFCQAGGQPQGSSWVILGHV